LTGLPSPSQVEALVNESTRADARKALEVLRSKFEQKTAANLRRYEQERERREKWVDEERSAAQQAEQEKRLAKQRADDAIEARRIALQKGITEGTTTVSMAQADLAATVATGAPSQVPSEPSAAAAQKPSVLSSYMPARQVAQPLEIEAMVQPLDAAAAEEKQRTAPAFMESSIRAQAEAYEADRHLWDKVCAAGGYDRRLWRLRYRQEALWIAGAYFHA
jgi:hypothetical protein